MQTIVRLCSLPILSHKNLVGVTDKDCSYKFILLDFRLPLYSYGFEVEGFDISIGHK